MATYLRKLKDPSGNYVCPVTKTSGVYMEDGSTLKDFLSKIYPVGSIYMSESNTSPASLFGGEWEAINNKFLIGSGNSYTVKSTGGEASHTLTVSEMPYHNHPLSREYRLCGIYGYNSGSPLWAKVRSDGGPDTSIDWTSFSESPYAGGNQPHNNIPPYYCVNIWKRNS